MSSLATLRPKFLPPPNPSSKRNPRAKNPPTRISRRASRQLEGKANAVEAADAAEDADEVDAVASKPLLKPSVPPSQRGTFRTCPFNKRTKDPRKRSIPPNPKRRLYR